MAQVRIEHIWKRFGAVTAVHDFDVTVGDGTPGEITTSLYHHLTDIQFGRAEDAHGWLYPLVR